MFLLTRDNQERFQALPHVCWEVQRALWDLHSAESPESRLNPQSSAGAQPLTCLVSELRG